MVTSAPLWSVLVVPAVLAGFAAIAVLADAVLAGWAAGRDGAAARRAAPGHASPGCPVVAARAMDRAGRGDAGRAGDPVRHGDGEPDERRRGVVQRDGGAHLGRAVDGRVGRQFRAEPDRRVPVRRPGAGL